MGCTQSKIDQEEIVTRCKGRRSYMKEAVTFRNAFAAANSHYAVSLKCIGAALSDYGSGEAEHNDHHHHHLPSAAAASSAAAPMDNIMPPPPLPPKFSSSATDDPATPVPLVRSSSMPVLQTPSTAAASASAHHSETIQEEEEEVDTPELSRSRVPPPPPIAEMTRPPPPPPEAVHGISMQYIFPDAEMLPGMSSIHMEPQPAPISNATEAAGMSYSSKAAEMTYSKSAPMHVEEVMEPPVPPPAPPLPPKGKKGKQSNQLAVAAEARRKAGNLNLVQILLDLDDQFLKASESGQEVTLMLEAHKLHYHSNFADNRGHIDHSARVMRVITWNRSFRGMQNPEDAQDDLDAEEPETHATVLDKLLAWEKKLYEEVKAGEAMKLEYNRKMELLNRQKKRNVSSETLEKTKAAVSHLHTRYIVDMQSLDSTVSEIYRLRDEQLYPKLVQLVEGMAKMWETMHVCHSNQQRIVQDLRALDISGSCKETTEGHHSRTEQLCRFASEWNGQFEKLVKHQKEYVQTLNNWVRLSMIPIESSLKEKVSSPHHVVDPPIQVLLRLWTAELEHLPDEVTKNAISSFAAVVRAIYAQQQEELAQRRRVEDLRKDHHRKLRAFQEWQEKYNQKRGPEDHGAEEGEASNPNDPLAERQFQIDSLKKRLEEQEELLRERCKQVREKSLGSLKTGLPALFNAVTDFSYSCKESYKKLYGVTGVSKEQR